MTKAKTGPKVVVADAVSDGKGGHLPVGAIVEAGEDTLKSLKAKGLIA